MCGRFLLSRPVDEVARLLQVDEVDDAAWLMAPRRNITPMSDVLALTALEARTGPNGARRAERDRSDDEGERCELATDHRSTSGVSRRLQVLRWGLVPAWAKDPRIGARAFNARAETIGTRPSFSAAARTRRCVIPADGFYEWAAPVPRPEAPTARAPSGQRRSKIPWRFRAADGGLLLLGGIYEASRDENGRTRVTCAILTTRANRAVAAVHDRMPVLLFAEDLERWLEPSPLDEPCAARLLAPSDPEWILAEEGVDPLAPCGGSALE
jgi:putative SOS response-associated peptidase YedK